ncbi:Putative protein [Zobellia galactanivorans]|uniref:Uncharacterized protein n=1 Tax=Zobellia galactanivorans (strain DSM 12802 / CCUG 47099 / CIP 106680 / NCIMB 13871 / Dsij) TaxID=63186 RepID=G0L2P3_ZOBGA|nr:Putative protein [Zobellia galactanivorans]
MIPPYVSVNTEFASLLSLITEEKTNFNKLIKGGG